MQTIQMNIAAAFGNMSCDAPLAIALITAMKNAATTEHYNIEFVATENLDLWFPGAIESDGLVRERICHAFNITLNLAVIIDRFNRQNKNYTAIRENDLVTFKSNFGYRSVVLTINQIPDDYDAICAKLEKMTTEDN